jgi:hypothetical protein
MGYFFKSKFIYFSVVSQQKIFKEEKPKKSMIKKLFLPVSERIRHPFFWISSMVLIGLTLPMFIIHEFMPEIYDPAGAIPWKSWLGSFIVVWIIIILLMYLCSSILIYHKQKRGA